MAAMLYLHLIETYGIGRLMSSGPETVNDSSHNSAILSMTGLDNRRCDGYIALLTDKRAVRQRSLSEDRGAGRGPQEEDR